MTRRDVGPARPLDSLERARIVATEIASIDPATIDALKRSFIAAVGVTARAAWLPAVLMAGLALIELALGTLLVFAIARFVGGSHVAVALTAVVFVVLAGLLFASAGFYFMVTRLPATVSTIADALKDKIIALKPHIVEASHATGFKGRIRSLVFVGRAIWAAKNFDEETTSKFRSLEYVAWMGTPAFWVAQAIVLAACAVVPVLAATAVLVPWLVTK